MINGNGIPLSYLHTIDAYSILRPIFVSAETTVILTFYFPFTIYTYKSLYIYFRHAYVTFSSPDGATEAFNAWAGKKLDGRKLIVEFAPDKEISQEGLFSLFIHLYSQFFQVVAC